MTEVEVHGSQFTAHGSPADLTAEGGRQAHSLLTNTFFEQNDRVDKKHPYSSQKRRIW